MKAIRVLLVALTAMFALIVVAVSGASAATEPALWLINGGDVPAAGVTVSIATEAGKPLLLEDMEPILNKPTAILCSVDSLGLLLPNGEDEQNSVIVLTCSFETAGECISTDPVLFESVHLPWLTRVVQITGSNPEEFEDELFAGTNGAPGWLIECTSVATGTKIDDTCTTTAGRTLLLNEANGEVDALFNTPISATCTSANRSSGLVEGLVLIARFINGALEPVAASLP
jgi:hypothetical protein